MNLQRTKLFNQPKIFFFYDEEIDMLHLFVQSKGILIKYKSDVDFFCMHLIFLYKKIFLYRNIFIWKYFYMKIYVQQINRIPSLIKKELRS